MRTTIVLGFVLGNMVLSLSTGRVLADEAKGKTLLLVGGSIHDWNGIGDTVEKTLRESGRFDVTRVNNDLDALLAERIEPYELVVYSTIPVGTIRKPPTCPCSRNFSCETACGQQAARWLNNDKPGPRVCSQVTMAMDVAIGGLGHYDFQRFT